MPLFGPGTEPFTSSRLRSTSTSWIDEPELRDALAAHAAGHLLPLNTRDGVADAPIEPGLRTLCEPCETGPRLKLCRLIVPWKPLPIEIPATLTFSPGWNASTVTVSPTGSSLSPRNSTR